MKEDKNVLQSKYLLQKQRADDLQEQLNEKNDRMANREKQVKHTEDLIRDLCSEILAKDKDEMVLGQAYSWGKVPIDTLIVKAQKSLKVQNETKARLLIETSNLAEERRLQNESFEDQLSQIMKGGNPFDPNSVKESIKNSEARNGGKSIVSSTANNSVEIIVEEENDAAIEVDGEMRNLSELINIAEDVAITSSSIPTVQSKTKNQRIEMEREKAIMSHVVDLNAYMEKMNDIMWDVVEVIGSEGCPRYSDIEARIIAKRGEDTKRSKIRVASSDLVKMKIINVTNVKLPLSPRAFLHWLSDIGKRIYRAHFGKQAVISEVEKVIAEHDNAEHGFGIIDIAKELEAKQIYKSVSAFNRSNPINLGNGRTYIPDIVCKKEKYSEYIEYERGLHTQPDFNTKCNKMAQVTRFLNFVVPNKEVLKHIMKQIEAWANKRGQKSIENLKVRVTTAVAIRNGNSDAINWIVEYDFKKGLDPVKVPEDL